jgi:hypothetical protein
LENSLEKIKMRSDENEQQRFSQHEKRGVNVPKKPYSRICLPSPVICKNNGIVTLRENEKSNKSDTGSKRNRLRGYTLVYLAAAFAVVFLVAPVVADESYMAGTPQLSVHLSGTNEFTPGEEYDVPIAIDNSGTIQFIFSKPGIISAGDVPNTAKNLVVTLRAADAPLVVKSDSQLVGNLLGSSSGTAAFHITVNSDAPAGMYYVPVLLNYTYLYSAGEFGDQAGTDLLSYSYKSVNSTVLVPVKIKSIVQITALSESTKDLNAGNEGYVFVSLKNTGFEDGKDATVMVFSPQNSPLLPTEGSYFIGNYPVGGVTNCTFKLAVDSSAQQKTYPLNVKVHYKNSDGVYVDSRTITIGVPVGSKITFEVEPVTTDITSGSAAIITVNFRNTGTATAYKAQARISAVDPFSSNDDTAFLGTMAPGDVRQASYKISVRDTTPKTFGLDSEILYRDALDNQITSDPLKVTVNVVQPGNFLANGIIVPVIIAGILIGLGYWAYSQRRKNR